MTNIEEEFYKTFDIKPVTLKDFNYNTLDYNFKTICINEVRYLKITAEVLLKLICIIVSVQTSYAINDKDYNNLKNKVLQKAVNLKNYIAQDVRALFEEGVEE